DFFLKTKNPPPQIQAAGLHSHSGEGGIRTRDGVTHTRVPGERTSPLCDVSNTCIIAETRVTSSGHPDPTTTHDPGRLQKPPICYKRFSHVPPRPIFIRRLSGNPVIYPPLPEGEGLGVRAIGNHTLYNTPRSKN